MRQVFPDDEFTAFFHYNNNPVRVDYIWHQMSKYIDVPIDILISVKKNPELILVG